MTIPISDANYLLSADKQLIDLHAWVRRGNREKKFPLLMFQSRVAIDGALPRGLWFRISVFPSYPDVATFQLDMEKPGVRTHLELYRLDWRPLTGHGNGMGDDCPDELRGLVLAAGDTHEHVCTDNVARAEDRIRASGVQAARKIEPDFDSYDAALAYVCDKLRIVNWREIPQSNAQNEMF